MYFYFFQTRKNLGGKQYHYSHFTGVNREVKQSAEGSFSPRILTQSDCKVNSYGPYIILHDKFPIFMN